VRGVGKEVEAATGGGGAGDGVAGAAKEIRDVMGELEASLAEADGMGAALGDGFDVAAAKASAYETAVQELVASGVSLDAVVGRQGQTLRELADTYLDLRSGVEGALEAQRTQQRLMSEGEAITGRLLTAEERAAAELERLDNLLTAGAISEEDPRPRRRAGRGSLHESDPCGRAIPGATACPGSGAQRHQSADAAIRRTVRPPGRDAAPWTRPRARPC
jgi:hypothetical protein